VTTPATSDAPDATASPSVVPMLERSGVLITVIALGYLASALGGLAISRQAGNIATLWPPNGMLVAALLLARRRRWTEILIAGAIGSVAANVVNGNTAITAASITAANLIEAFIAAAIDGISTFAVCSKKGRVTSLSSTGNVYF
jgi:integral membrane sensor domain MASE1